MTHLQAARADAGVLQDVPNEANDDAAAAAPANAAQDDEFPICSICHESMRPRVEELTTLECGHTYHAYCIGEWHRVGRRADNECPLGRCHLRIREPEPPLKLGLIISALLLLVFGFESTATTATTATTTTTTTTPAADNYWNKHWKQLTITNIIFSNYIHTTVDICGALVAQD